MSEPNQYSSGWVRGGWDLADAPRSEKELERLATLRTAALNVVPFSVQEYEPGRYRCTDCGVDVTDVQSPPVHDDDCDWERLRAALSEETPG